jgi:hypothetical protein
MMVGLEERYPPDRRLQWLLAAVASDPVGAAYAFVWPTV